MSDIQEKIRELICRHCDGISHADTCELNKEECPILQIMPDQIEALFKDYHQLPRELIKLLDGTREPCLECGGGGLRWKTEPITASRNIKTTYEDTCPECHGTGKTDWKPKKLVRLVEDQTFPESRYRFKSWADRSYAHPGLKENMATAIQYYEEAQQDMLKGDETSYWAKIKRIKE